MEKHGFAVVDFIGEYEILALSFDGSIPSFAKNVKKQSIENDDLTIYFSMQCPYIPDCTKQIKKYCSENNITLNLVAVDSLEKAKALPCVFNNWAVFYKGKFETVHLLNEGCLKKFLNI